MTLRRLAYTLILILSVIWLCGFIPVMMHIWSLETYCLPNEEHCFPLVTLMSRVQLANLAALSLTASLTPPVIVLMMIPFCIWFWKQIKNKKSKTYHQ